jgi:hypothetical protein
LLVNKTTPSAMQIAAKMMTPIRFFITVVEDANREVLWQASRLC